MPTPPPFWKSSLCATNTCVQFALAPDGTALIRDSKDSGQGPVLRFTQAEWEAFTAGVRNGEFDITQSARDAAMLRTGRIPGRSSSADYEPAPLVSLARLIEIARDLICPSEIGSLLTPDGERLTGAGEYVRAMTELICDAAGLSQDEYKATMMEAIGLPAAPAWLDGLPARRT